MGLEALLAELEAFGLENDRSQTERSRQMLNIPHETGQFLEVLVRASAARHILEIGMSNGYSTLWLALAARANGGQVTTVEQSVYKIGLAKTNFQRAGMEAVITQVHGSAADFLAAAASESFDFIFLDAGRREYPDWLPDLKRVLCPGGLWVVDNAVSHQHELAPFFALVAADPAFTTCTVPVGKGEYLAVKSADGGQ